MPDTNADSAENTAPPEKRLPPKLAYTIKEAGYVSGLGKTTLFARLADGSLRKIKVGRRTLITAESLHALIAGEA